MTSPQRDMELLYRKMKHMVKFNAKASTMSTNVYVINEQFVPYLLQYYPSIPFVKYKDYNYALDLTKWTKKNVSFGVFHERVGKYGSTML